MKFYRVDLCKKEIIKLFEPRIPKYVLEDENKDISRVCVTSTIEGALGSVPWGGRHMLNKGENMIFRIYEFDLCEIDEKFIVTPDTLVKKGYVPDALCYDEYWVLTSIKPSKVYNITIEYFKERSGDYFESSFYELNSDELNDEAFDINEYWLGSCTVIYDLHYNVVKDEDTITGDVFDINLSDFYYVEVNDLEEELNWIIEDYMSSENNIKEIITNEHSITIKTEVEEGLYLSLFKQQLMKRVGCLS